MGDRGNPSRKMLENRRGKRRDKAGSDGNGNNEKVIRPSAKVDRRQYTDAVCCNHPEHDQPSPSKHRLWDGCSKTTKLRKKSKKNKNCSARGTYVAGPNSGDHNQSNIL